jgi:excisionase family DNA binding protein
MASRTPSTETRSQLLERLLNPLIKIGEAAKLLEVSLGSVRRYSDCGALQAVRSPGGQRRFRLCDVLALLDARQEEETDE